MTVNEMLAKIAQQEHSLTFRRFDADVAWRLGSQLRQRASESGIPVVIDVRQFHQPLFFAALPGSTPDNIEWVRRKANVVARFHRSSFSIGQEMKAKGTTLEERYGLPQRDFADHGGAFPITVAESVTIGSITVSGLPQQEDHMLVVRGLCALFDKDMSEFELPAT